MVAELPGGLPCFLRLRRSCEFPGCRQMKDSGSVAKGIEMWQKPAGRAETQDTVANPTIE